MFSREYAFNLDQSRMLSFGNELKVLSTLNPLPDDKNSTLSKLKAFSDDKFSLTQNNKFIHISQGRKHYKNRKNAGYQRYLLFPIVFKRPFPLRGL